jgi:hypothetical protein
VPGKQVYYCSLFVLHHFVFMKKLLLKYTFYTR